MITENLLVGGAPVVEAMRGTFVLRLVSANVISAQYALDAVDFATGPDKTLKGSGTYTIAGEVAIRRTLTLMGDLKTADGTRKVSFTNDNTGFTRIWPMLDFTLKQTNGTAASTITLKIAAAPIREIWFSTATGFHGAKLPAGEQEVVDGDLLSSSGRVVKHSGEFQENFPGPTFLNIGLDALDIRPGAELAFSTDTHSFLNDGDVAFLRTPHYFRWADIMSPFTATLTTDPGLDALSFISDSEFYFSTEQDVKGTTTTLHHGDLLQVNMGTHVGSVFKRNGELLAAFHRSTGTDVGLDAVFIWPTGEIWFSVRDGFTDSQLGAIGAGDILSNSGYIVYRNLELVGPFAPIEDVNNFGLDSLTVISDVMAAPGGATLNATISGNSVFLTWTGAGRVFQVERASDVAGPYAPISEIIPALSFEDSTARPGNATTFYRVRQW